MGMWWCAQAFTFSLSPLQGHDICLSTLLDYEHITLLLKSQKLSTLCTYLSLWVNFRTIFDKYFSHRNSVFLCSQVHGSETILYAMITEYMWKQFLRNRECSKWMRYYITYVTYACQLECNSMSSGNTDILLDRSKCVLKINLSK